MEKINDYNDYIYEGNDLGLSFGKEQSTFRLWAPLVKEVSLCLFEDAGNYDRLGKVKDEEPSEVFSMELDSQTGVWSTTIRRNLDGYFYLYRIRRLHHPDTYQVDPYAYAVSANGQRGAIVDKRESDPEGFRTYKKPDFLSYTDAIIYEVHTKDFSIQDEAAFSNKGLTLAFTEKGLQTAEGRSIGIDHLQELGITHVQVMPSYDFQTVNERLALDETHEGASYNWGYDPQHYNALEGSYSSNPEDPQARMREFKQMVMALHQAGIRVILDVVYNHTYEIYGGPFEKQIPSYAYRFFGDGGFANGSGCGNEIASERPMMRKYILDSLFFWLEEYRVDGFRFDLMALLDVETMKSIDKEVHARFGEEIILLGEPWQAGGSPLRPKDLFYKGKQKGSKIAVFNDHLRDAIKGGTRDNIPGFISVALETETDIAEGLQGGIHSIAKEPGEVVQYASAHDDLLLWDKLVRTFGLEEETGALDLHDGALMGLSKAKFLNIKDALMQADPYRMIKEEEALENHVVKAFVLGLGLVLTAQGIAFFHAGEEFLRSKFGDHNSYKSGELINQIRWENKDKFPTVYEYVKGLIHLRKSNKAFRLGSREAIQEHMQVLRADNGVVITKFTNLKKLGNAYDEVLCIYQANLEAEEMHIPGKWDVYVDAKKASAEPFYTVENAVKAEGTSMLVLGR